MELYKWREPDVNSDLTERDWRLAAGFAMRQIIDCLEAYEFYGRTDSWMNQVETWEQILLQIQDREGNKISKHHIKWWAHHQEGILRIKSFPHSPDPSKL